MELMELCRDELKDVLLLASGDSLSRFSREGDLLEERKMWMSFVAKNTPIFNERIVACEGRLRKGTQKGYQKNVTKMLHVHK